MDWRNLMLVKKPHNQSNFGQKPLMVKISSSNRNLSRMVSTKIFFPKGFYTSDYIWFFEKRHRRYSSASGFLEIDGLNCEKSLVGFFQWTPANHRWGNWFPYKILTFWIWFSFFLEKIGQSLLSQNQVHTLSSLWHSENRPSHGRVLFGHSKWITLEWSQKG